MKLSANFALSFLGTGPKTKTRNWRKVFLQYALLQVRLPLPQAKVLQSCLNTHACFIACLESFFI